MQRSCQSNSVQVMSFGDGLPFPGTLTRSVGRPDFSTGAAGKGDAVERHVVCVDATSGEILWDRTAAVVSGEALQNMNSWATPSCVTDGERVVAFFGAGGLHCFDNPGEKLWSKDLGTFPGGWGVGASPIIYKDLLIQNCDAEGASYLVGLDRKTGDEVWRTAREAKPRGGWSTPIVIDVDGHQELILNGEFGVAAYDPDSGNPCGIAMVLTVVGHQCRYGGTACCTSSMASRATCMQSGRVVAVT